MIEIRNCQKCPSLIESIFTLSESFPIAYIVHYVPFTVQELLHWEQLTDLSRGFSVWLVRRFDEKLKYDVMSKKSLIRFVGSDELQALNA